MKILKRILLVPLFALYAVVGLFSDDPKSADEANKFESWLVEQWK